MRIAIFCLILIVCALQSAAAQELTKTPAESNVNERIRLLESEVERQNSKLDER